MRAKLLLAACLLLAAVTGAAAGEKKGPPPPLRVGELVKLNDAKPAGTLTGWVCWHDKLRFKLRIESATGEAKFKPGKEVLLLPRRVKIKQGKSKKERWVPDRKEAANIRRIRFADRLEVQWYRQDKRVVVAALKLLTAFPREGTVTGKGHRRLKHGFELILTRTPKGGEYLVGQRVYLAVDWVKNKKGKWQPDPEKLKLIEICQRGRLIEVKTRLDSRLRLLEVKDVGAAPGGGKPPPKKKPKPGGKKPPPPMASKGDPEPL